MLPPDAALCSINDHLVEPADLWRGGRDAPVVQRVDGEERWVFGDESLSMRQLSVLAADGLGRATTLAGAHRAAFDPAARLAAMDDDGVELQTLLPHAIGFAGERLRHMPTGGWADAVRRYNDFVLGEFCAAA